MLKYIGHVHEDCANFIKGSQVFVHPNNVVAVLDSNGTGKAPSLVVLVGDVRVLVDKTFNEIEDQLNSL